jgi:hypothetical protein
MSKPCLTLVLLAAAAGCGGPPEPEPDAREATEERGALRDAIQQPLDRARVVEDIAAGRKDELDEALQ